MLDRDLTVTLDQLIACGLAPTQARQFLESINAFLPRFEIDSRVRQAAFIAQAAHESANFTRLEEDLYYTTPERIRAIYPNRVTSLSTAAKLCKNPKALANYVYSDKNGNGDSASNDGWVYRGRGIFMLTGRANYLDAAHELCQPYVAAPELISQVPDAVMTAAWYWHNNKLNILADASNIDAITRAINGPAMAGKVERKQRFERCLSAL